MEAGKVNSQPAPVVLFVYNRPVHTLKTLEALAANTLAPETPLYIFADGAKATATSEQAENIRKVRSIIRRQKWCSSVTITEADANQGLAGSVIKGVTEIIARHGKIIVLEDDMITSPHFLTFMNQALDKYKNTERVISIHGYCVPVNYKEASCFFIKGADCWGWATWKRGWDEMIYDPVYLRDEIIRLDAKYEFDFYGTYPYFEMLNKLIAGKVDSWAILWYASAFIKNRLTLYPAKSLVKNIGNDDTATHKQSSSTMNVELHDAAIEIPDLEIEESKTARKLISRYFFSFSGLRKKIKSLLKIGY